MLKKFSEFKFLPPPVENLTKRHEEEQEERTEHASSTINFFQRKLDLLR